MADPSGIKLGDQQVYVNFLSILSRNSACAALSTNELVVLDLDKSCRTQSLKIQNNVIGIHGSLESPSVLQAVDENSTMHIFDIRAGSSVTKSFPAVNGLLADCFASSDSYIAISSSVHTDPDAPKKKKKKTSEDEDDEVEFAISVFDIRGKKSPLILQESHSEIINSLAFSKDGRYLYSGSADGLLNSFDCAQNDEDDAILTTNQTESSIMKVGCAADNLIFCCTDDNKTVVFKQNDTEDIDIFLKWQSSNEGRFLIDLLTGGSEDYPLAVLECTSDGKLYLSNLTADGKNTEIVDEWNGHSDIVRCTARLDDLLLTGGEDGSVVVKQIDLRPSGGGLSKKSKKEKKKSGQPY